MDITQFVIAERDRALLGGDYSTYHAQAARKIHSLRKRLGIATVRGRKYTPKAPVSAENVASNVEWVKLLLASSERSWASAMAMKSLQSTENTQKPIPRSTKRQIASRLRRATVYSENLVSIIKDRDTTKASISDVLEAKAYLSLMKGALAFEKSRWQACLENYSVARITYTVLGSSGKTDQFRDLLSSTVDPSIRYAAYQLKLPRTKPLQEIAVESFPQSDAETRQALQDVDPYALEPPSARSQSSPAAGVSTITWRTRTVQIEDATISQALSAAMEQEKTLTTKMQEVQSDATDILLLAAAYEDVINSRQDVTDATKLAIDELTAEGVPGSDPRIQSLQVTRTAVNYAVIEWRIGRNRILCGPQDGLLFEPAQPSGASKMHKEDKSSGHRQEKRGRKLTRLRERVALYDSILQSIDSVKELPGVIADVDFVHELDCKRSYFRSLKCLNIGRSHGLNASMVNALALYARALGLAQNASGLRETGAPRSPTSPIKFDLSSGDVQNLSAHLHDLVTRSRALVELNHLRSEKPTSHRGARVEYPEPLVERLHLNHYEDDVDLSNLVLFPPQIRPVPVKPLFFDLAWNYIQYPGHAGGRGDEGVINGKVTAATAEEEKKEAPQPAKRSWFGFGR